MSTASASSLVLPSLNPRTISLYNAKPTSLSSFSSLKFHAKSISISSAVFQPLSSRFVRSVAVSSEFGQEEEVFSDGEAASFSPDLKIFVGNLPFTVDSAQLAGLFETAGNVEMVEVIYDKVTGRSRGFGFVTMSSAQEAEAAAQQFNGYELEGRSLRVNAGPPPPREDSYSRGPRDGGSRGRFDGGSRGRFDSGSRGRFDGGNRSSFDGGNRSSFDGGNRSSFDGGNRVYVGNLSWGVDDAALETLFSEQGKVVEAKVVYDRDSGRSRGFGFVTYSSAEEVDSAIDSLNGADLDGRSIRVSAAEAKPRRQF